MKSIGFGAYDGFLSVKPASLSLGQYRHNPHQAQAQETGLSLTSQIVMGAVIASQLGAYIYKEVAGTPDFRWHWYDTVLIPSYMLFGIFEIFGKK
jgi:hypothetical protein